jgi:hypothetical protein
MIHPTNILGKVMKKELVCIGFKFLHMGKYSGYDQIKKYVKYDKYFDYQKYYNWIQKKAERNYLFDKIYFKVFGSRLWYAELLCIAYAITHRNIIFHILYAENIYKYLGIFKGKSNKVICTYHQPPQFFETNQKFLKYSGGIDKIICMSSDLEEYLKNRLGSSSIKFIPHGVDTTYFKNIKAIKKKSILMIGNWLRDFQFAAELFKKILIERNDIYINVITMKNNYSYFENSDQLKLLSNISDIQLKILYNECSILFLPLKKMTANNALLEGASCGCKIIIATNEKIEMYFDNSIVEVLPLNINIVYKRLLNVLDNNNKYNTDKIVNYVKKYYDWSVIGNITEKYILE